MKEPKLNELKFDAAETRRIRRSAGARQAVKITINLDGDTLALLRRDADATGIPYQRLINQVLRENVKARVSTESRLTRQERELAALKKRLAA